MKLLKRMLLIHWHYFTYEMIDFDKINFLTGKNSSGKSTIIDAMQLVLLSDTSGSYFNKAANTRGDRTLTGYLRCELGDDEDSGYRYLRNGPFTSYIILEFFDDVRKNYFSAGCCFDTYGENDCQRLFFKFNGEIPQNGFMAQNAPFNIEKLRTYIRANYTAGQHYMTNVNRDFREELCGSLGGLQTGRYYDLMRKAVSFDPNADIQNFITEFVCGDEQEVSIAEMKDNIRSYDSLKIEAVILKDRINMLTKIGETFDEYIKNKENEILYSYLIDRAEIEINLNDINKNKRKAEQLGNDLVMLEKELSDAETNQSQYQAERDGLKLQYDLNENARRLDELNKEIYEKQKLYDETVKEFEHLSAIFRNAIAGWKRFINNIDDINVENLNSVRNPILKERIGALLPEGGSLRDKINGLLAAFDKSAEAKADVIIKTGFENLVGIIREADAYRDGCAILCGRLRDEQAEVAKRQAELIREKESLAKGVYKFPRDTVDLKEAIESRLRVKFGPGAKAAILAEAVEIHDDRWRNAIEGYLHTQKFYIIVAPEHFYTAFQLYDSIKRQKNVYATGLVDTEKLSRLDPTKDDGSLADEIEVEKSGESYGYDAQLILGIRLYVNFTLGRVMKCDSIRDLRKHRVSITDEGVLYQNFVVRAIDPGRWTEPAIGRGAILRRLEAVSMEIGCINGEFSYLASMINALNVAENGRFLRLGDYEAGQVVNSAKLYGELPVLQETLNRLTADASSIDRSEIEIIKKRLNERENALREVAQEIRRISENTGAVKKELFILENETLPNLANRANSMAGALAGAYLDAWVTETGSVRYDREISVRGSADEIFKAFPREQSRSRNAKDVFWNQTREHRQRYNETYKTGYDVYASDNETYNKVLREFTDNKLPEYEAKIEDTRNKAYQQFQEDFLSKLQSNIRNAKSHIDELNASMRSASFGEDTYQFRVSARPDNKRYYDMIVDDMLLVGGYNLLSDQYNAKYKAEMSELFELLTNDGGLQNTHGFDDYEKRVLEYTDYKSYLQFELEAIKPNGESERLSKTIRKKSGGETQTPFYIAVLASFVQLYRTGRDKIMNTSRLIIFDEAFSKMDGERIIQSIDLLRQFQFQVVFAAPPDKIPDIAVLADKNLCVLREGHKACVRAFEPRQLLEMADGD